jgi:outer membrane protein assembly factor BamD
LSNKRIIIPALFLLTLIFGCSGVVDTSKFNADEYYNYVYNLYTDEDYEKAILEFQNFLLQYSGSSFSDDAQYYLGMTYFQRRQYLLAAYEFSKLIKNIPASPFVPDAQFMLAESYYELSPAFPLDQAYSKKSIEEFQAFIDFFPSNAKVEESEKKIAYLTERLAEKEYQSAVIYEKMEYERAAIKYFALVADTYHDTKFAPMALYRKINLELKKNMNNEALSDINIYITRYPTDASIPELKDLETKISNSLK